ncbi:septal ring lytic transglycosylase RlpA family protein [Hippea maritima]|uniref:Probable endolytic peptidoglycan transglycosylase RlpA n=1 Tax=Hippea maritima (strain ATCC 700847 / DSM 10411 / MH2) TaxID=760142 RepID=F2LXE6_HIPMA|nr:septal ring lytic transglycosylase RlpA family protein [Hippea maritima]AEA34260.1 rare lipoprotein A [Hippea maritima DSM 10411]
MIKRFTVFAIALLILTSCTHRGGYIGGGYYPYNVMSSVPVGYTQEGIASWYGPNFHGKRTANGEVYNMYDHTAASKTLPFNTIVRVINLNNGKSTVVRINDRGPFVKNRIIDLSYAAAKDIGMIGTGTAPVKIVVIGGNSYAKNSYTYKSKPQNIDELDKITINQNIDVGFTDYAVQLGSFRSLRNALKFRDRLNSSVKGLYIVKAIVNGQRFYRVLVGNFDSKDDALRFALKYIAPVVISYCIVKR